MDQQKLRSLVFEKTGIKIDTSDPVFAVVAMNEALLEEAVQRHLLVLEQSSKAILLQLQALSSQTAAGRDTSATSTNAALADDIWETSAAASAKAQQVASTQPQEDNLHQGGKHESQGTGTSVGDTVRAPSVATSAGNHPLSSQLRLAAITALMTVALMLPTLNMFAPKPSAPATSPTAAATLSPQQETQLKQFEKLQKLLPTLDAKARAQIEAELKKP
ncbi:MAG: hypothetical protein HYZ45_06425 [Burkholderiales bacterium]|nr:hypothetical protein [Burkholderiales bacterium]